MDVIEYDDIQPGDLIDRAIQIPFKYARCSGLWNLSGAPKARAHQSVEVGRREAHRRFAQMARFTRRLCRYIARYGYYVHAICGWSETHGMYVDAWIRSTTGPFLGQVRITPSTIGVPRRDLFYPTPYSLRPRADTTWKELMSIWQSINEMEAKEEKRQWLVTG